MAHWRYKGGGFIPGVPARDLTESEMRHFEQEATGGIRKSGLYERVEDPPVEKEQSDG